MVLVKSKTFKGGIHPKEYKELCEDKSIERFPLSTLVRIPLLQHFGKSAIPVVKVGDEVKTGQLIATADKGLSCNVHASITGKVTNIKRFPHPTMGDGIAIEIRGDGKTDILDEGIKETGESWETKSKEEILNRIRECGVAGMGGAMFPTFRKLSPPKEKEVDTLVINGAECEPFVTCDYRIMIEETEKFIEGIEIIRKVLEVENVVIGIEDNKPEAIKVVSEKGKEKGYKVIGLKTKYPQGGEKQLIKALLDREVPIGGLPFDVGVVVQNVSTCVAVYDAVVYNKGLFERVLTVSGDAVGSTGNFRVRIGTLFRDIVMYCGGATKKPLKLIMGGPMMGITQYTWDVPVIKGTNGIILLSKAIVKECKPEPCIRCGKCVLNCPMNLNPGRLATLIENQLWDEVKEAGVMDCIECGVCAYTCPSARNIVQLVKWAKQMVKKK